MTTANSKRKEPDGILSGVPKTDAFILIPEGLYEFCYKRYDGPVIVFGPREKRIFIHWEIVTPGPYLSTTLFQAFRFYERWGCLSRFYRTWVIANGSRPRARTRMSMSVFKNKVFRGYVRTVKPKYDQGPLKGQRQPECLWYSIVEEILEKVVG